MPSVSRSLPNFSGNTIGDGCLRLLEPIGRGAHGCVYHAVPNFDTDPDDTQHYAVKCLFKEEYEAQVLSRTNEVENHWLVSDHDHVVTWHGQLEDEQFVYFVLDYCSGGDMFSLINSPKMGYGTTEDVKAAFLQLVDALEYCHAQGVYHRDLKPENILCSADKSQLYLSDFGLATREPISLDTRCGTSEYMSPECIRPRSKRSYVWSKESDVWALGVILVNMITRGLPWHYALPSDRLFRAYLTVPDFFTSYLDISREAAGVLRRIFDLRPMCRISLADLRTEISKVDNFWVAPPPPLPEPAPGPAPVEVSQKYIVSEGRASSSAGRHVLDSGEGQVIVEVVSARPATPTAESYDSSSDEKSSNDSSSSDNSTDETSTDTDADSFNITTHNLDERPPFDPKRSETYPDNPTCSQVDAIAETFRVDKPHPFQVPEMTGCWRCPSSSFVRPVKPERALSTVF